MKARNPEIWSVRTRRKDPRAKASMAPIGTCVACVVLYPISSYHIRSQVHQVVKSRLNRVCHGFMGVSRLGTDRLSEDASLQDSVDRSRIRTPSTCWRSSSTATRLVSASWESVGRRDQRLDSQARRPHAALSSPPDCQMRSAKCKVQKRLSATSLLPFPEKYFWPAFSMCAQPWPRGCFFDSCIV
jgi:hypothetical protein